MSAHLGGLIAQRTGVAGLAVLPVERCARAGIKPGPLESPSFRGQMPESPMPVPSPLQKAESALALLNSILKHDHARITRQPALAFKDAARGIADRD